MPKVVAVIPARKGSKRLPDKNKRMFCGKPLICWTLDVVLECEFIDEIVVSTDDPDIIDILNENYSRCNNLRRVMRPKELAQDDTPMWKVVSHALKDYTIKTEIIILLQPTSPLRTIFDISMAYQIFRERVSCSVISVFREDILHFKLNGAIYIFSLANLVLTKSIMNGEFTCVYIMPEERSIDIDTLEEFERAERIMKRRIERNG